MALDEALLEQAAMPTLRLYTWDPPALSLGYFQDHATVTTTLPAPMTVVRRITGGGAIWHQHEVTFCLVARLGHDGLPGRTRDCYPLLHEAVRRALVAHGAQVQRQPQTVGDRRYRQEPRCFASPAADDLVAADGGKVLGSAGRTRRDRVLIHGSLKLASNPWDRSAVAPCGVDAATARAALLEGLCAALNARGVPGELDQAERTALTRIRQARYGDDAWVKHRRGPRA
jgi:lipoyl(octanoyl) transferase